MKNIKVNIPDKIDTIRIGVGEIRVGFMVDDVPIYCDILHHDGHVIDTENSDLEKGIITFKKEESKYPMELMYGLFNVDFPLSNELAHKYKTFIRLVETCKEWNRIDGFEADWNYWKTEKYCIHKNTGSIRVSNFGIISRPLVLKDRETAELFLETFRTEIELVKDLI